MRTREKVLAELEKVNWIKQICYGLGLPPKSAVEFWADCERLTAELQSLGSIAPEK